MQQHSSTEPPFVPKPGQKDFTNARVAPVLNCIVWYRDRILMVKRSATMRFYPNYWNGISGFLDDDLPVKEKAQVELTEELGLKAADILSLEEGKPFTQEEPDYQKKWIVHPVLAKVSTDRITLNWEAQEYQWVSPDEALVLKLLPGFEKVLGTFFKTGS